MRDGVTVRSVRVAGKPSGRIGVVVAFGGERSFVADRGAADELRPGGPHGRAGSRADLLHVPAYSLIGEPLGDAGRRAIELARAAGALVSLDLASAAPLLAKGRRAARRLVDDAAPDILFSTAAEAEAYLGGYDPSGLLESAPLAVVKRGAGGATLLARGEAAPLRFEVATPPLDRDRHDRRRRRVRRGLPRGVPRRAARCTPPAGLAPSRRPRRPSRRSSPADDRVAGADAPLTGGLDATLRP